MLKSEIVAISKVHGKPSLPLMVEGKESYDSYWEEATKTLGFSRLGATFELERERPVGSLLVLNFDMPAHLRAFDYSKNRYRVWGLVQHCNPAFDDYFAGFQVGVAFVGEHPPDDYFEKPKGSYRISGMDAGGLWTVEPLEQAFKTRAFYRFPYPIKCQLAVLDREGVATYTEKDIVTENIGIGGTALTSTLKLDFGACIRFSTENPKFTALSVVRRREVDGDESNESKLHLQFSDAEFPISEVVESF